MGIRTNTAGDFCGMNAILIGIYIFAMTVANLVVWWFGPWISPINAFVLIGLDLTLRDVMHERLMRWQLVIVVMAGGVLTWLLNPGASQIALASAVAFTVAAVADWAAYSALRSTRWVIKANASNAVGSAVDSIIFPTLAFGVLLPQIIAMQFLAKLVGGWVWSVVLYRLRIIPETKWRPEISDRIWRLRSYVRALSRIGDARMCQSIAIPDEDREITTGGELAAWLGISFDDLRNFMHNEYDGRDMQGHWAECCLCPFDTDAVLDHFEIWHKRCQYDPMRTLAQKTK